MWLSVVFWFHGFQWKMKPKSVFAQKSWQVIGRKRADVHSEGSFLVNSISTLRGRQITKNVDFFTGAEAEGDVDGKLFGRDVLLRSWYVRWGLQACNKTMRRWCVKCKCFIF
ncbi:unnamed protein product [Amoebophrya sp. A120]|nr:unnamed protein product [Amoebophrya sp. A120]|eukprot:GSA120T00018256001.1